MVAKIVDIDMNSSIIEEIPIEYANPNGVAPWWRDAVLVKVCIDFKIAKLSRDGETATFEGDFRKELKRRAVNSNQEDKIII